MMTVLEKISPKYHQQIQERIEKQTLLYAEMSIDFIRHLSKDVTLHRSD